VHTRFLYVPTEVLGHKYEKGSLRLNPWVGQRNS